MNPPGANSPLIFYRLFVPDEIRKVATFNTGQGQQSSTELRLTTDTDGEGENVFKIPLMTSSQACAALPADGNFSIVVRFGSALVPQARDSLYLMISSQNCAIGFKISKTGPIKGAYGTPGRFLGNVVEKEDDTVWLNTSDWPDEFVITLKPKQYWGSIYCSQGNGTKQCVIYNEIPNYRGEGMTLDLYRDQINEEYTINYIEVKIFADSTFD